MVGKITVEFDDQKVMIQLPEYVLSNYINIDGKPRIALINGPLVLVDNENNLKSVIMIKGLVKKRVMLNQVWQANITEAGKKHADMIEGVIYKSVNELPGVQSKVKQWLDYKGSE